MLTNDVIELCTALKKGSYVVEIFSKDILNTYLIRNARHIFEESNFRYYVLDNIDFLRDISLADVRYLCLYATGNEHIPHINRKLLNDKSCFCACFENYLDTCEIVICKRFYTDEIHKLLD